MTPMQGLFLVLVLGPQDCYTYKWDDSMQGLFLALVLGSQDSV